MLPTTLWSPFYKSARPGNHSLDFLTLETHSGMPTGLGVSECVVLDYRCPLGQDPADGMAVNVRKSEVAATEPIGQIGIVEPQQVEYRRV